MIGFMAEAFLAELFGARLFLGELQFFGLGQRARVNSQKMKAPK